MLLIVYESQESEEWCQYDEQGNQIHLEISGKGEVWSEYSDMKGYSFSKPKIYDGGGDINKRWYVYFSYRNLETGKMKRQPPVYLNVNRIKNNSDSLPK